jgi:hypothetical protein
MKGRKIVGQNWSSIIRILKMKCRKYLADYKAVLEKITINIAEIVYFSDFSLKNPFLEIYKGLLFQLNHFYVIYYFK